MGKAHVLVTGGAGYIGSLLVGELLRRGYRVTVVDDCLFGAEGLLAYFGHQRFCWVKGDIGETLVLRQVLHHPTWGAPEAIVHLAAIVGFPACQAVGRQVAWRYNVEATQRLFEEAQAAGVRRLVFASTYSVYGMAADGQPITEEGPLNPQSLYAETKAAAERYLLAHADAPTAPVVLRLATLYGLSPRMRFDLLVNQFVLDAFVRHALLIYQRGYTRSFLHVRDAVQGFVLALEAPEEKVRGQVFNLGTEAGNLTKDEVVALVLQRMPETTVQYKDLSFGGDMRDIALSGAKIQRVLGFAPRFTVADGVREVHLALKEGIFKNPLDERFRNARFIVQ